MWEPNDKRHVCVLYLTLYLQLNLSYTDFSLRNNAGFLPPSGPSLLDAAFVCRERPREPSSSHCLLATPRALGQVSKQSCG